MARRELMADTYAVLEYQGVVISESPTYNEKTNELSFTASCIGTPNMKFFCKGKLAKAWRLLLTQGSVVQLQAIPVAGQVSVKCEDCDRREWVQVAKWEVRAMLKLGDKQKFNLLKYAEPSVLDGLMPTDYEVDDVGSKQEHEVIEVLTEAKEAKGE